MDSGTGDRAGSAGEAQPEGKGNLDGRFRRSISSAPKLAVARVATGDH